MSDMTDERADGLLEAMRHKPRVAVHQFNEGWSTAVYPPFDIEPEQEEAFVKSLAEATAVIDYWRKMAGELRTTMLAAANAIRDAAQSGDQIGPACGDGVITWPLGAEIEHRLRKAAGKEKS